MKFEIYQFACKQEDTIVKDIGYGLILKRLGLQRVAEFESVVFQKSKIHCKPEERQKFTEALHQEILNTEVDLASRGLFFIIEDEDSQIMATFSGIKYNDKASFPFESIFNISVFNIAQDYNILTTNIWHCDNFTLNIPALRKLGIETMRLCMDEIFQVFSEAVVYGHNDRYCLAETNLRVEKLYKNACFECQPLSEFKYYWGGENRVVIIDLVTALRKRTLKQSGQEGP